MEVTQAMWDDISHRLTETRDFARAANEKAGEARDSSLTNGVILEQVVRPKLNALEATVADHEEAKNRTSGALWTFGVIGSLVALALAILPFLLR